MDHLFVRDAQGNYREEYSESGYMIELASYQTNACRYLIATAFSHAEDKLFTSVLTDVPITYHELKEYVMQLKEKRPEIQGIVFVTDYNPLCTHSHMGYVHHYWIVTVKGFDHGQTT